MSQEIRTVVAEGPTESAVRRRCVPETRTRFVHLFPSEVMEEEVAPRGEEGSTGPAGSGGEGRKTQEMQKKKGSRRADGMQSELAAVSLTPLEAVHT